jgi:hypothetical protein
MKKEARLQAQKMFLKSGGRVSNRDIAKAVNVNALTVGRWKRDDDWEAKLVGAEHGAGNEGTGIIRKKAARDQALKLYLDAGGNITNKELAQVVDVSPATISKWKETDRWIDRVSPLDDALGEETEEVSLVGDMDLGELVAPEQIIALNKRIGEQLARDYLSSSEIAELAGAKHELLGAVEIYLSIVREVGEISPED